MITTDQHQATPSESAPSEVKTDWASLIKQWKTSGLPQATYCEANKINYNQFVYQNTKQLAREKAGSKLLPVKLTHPEQTHAAQNNFVLHYPSGLKLSIPVNAHPEAIKTLINCLEAR